MRGQWEAFPVKAPARYPSWIANASLALASRYPSPRGFQEPSRYQHLSWANPVPYCNSEKTRSGEQPLVVTGQLNALLLPAHKLNGCEVNGIQCPHRNRKWLQRARQHWPNHFNHRHSTDQITDCIAMRILQLVRVDPIPNLAFKKPAGHQWLIPKRLWREIDLPPKDEREPLNYRGRSPVRSIALQIAQQFVDCHHRFTCWWLAPDQDRWRNPALPTGVQP